MFCAGQSLWPIILCITSLPPEIRMNAEFLLLGGIWFGPVKPDMETILTPILEAINKIDIPLQGHENLKARLLVGVFDLPAKAMALNFTQFNGEYGCPYCLDKGTHMFHRRLYLPSDSHEARKLEDVKKWADEAKVLGKPVYGIKGPSILSTHINLLKSVPIDYMHAVLEGVTKSLLNCWFNSIYHKSKFYLGRRRKEIDRALLRIKPPHDFRRTPRSILTSKYWKAAEYRAWLLYYSVPILSNYLPRDYIYHLSLLVTAMHILLGNTICIPDDLEAAHLMLTHFYELIPSLYPQTMCTMNVHSLIHLSEFVHRWGPLWCFSTFGFENFNGYMKKHCHGTRNVLPQLIRAVRLRQTLPSLQREIEENENARTMAFLENVSGIQKQDKTGVLGKVVHRILNEEETRAIREAGFQLTGNSLPVYPRYRKDGVVYISQRSTKRDSSICKIRIKNGSNSKIAFGSILKFCLVTNTLVILVTIFDSTDESALPESMAHSSLHSSDIKAARCISLFVNKVKKLSLSKKLIAICPEDLLEKSVHIPVKYSPTDYIVTMPNTFEHH